MKPRVHPLFKSAPDAVQALHKKANSEARLDRRAAYWALKQTADIRARQGLPPLPPDPNGERYSGDEVKILEDTQYAAPLPT
jgi:hypothetical protein